MTSPKRRRWHSQARAQLGGCMNSQATFPGCRPQCGVPASHTCPVYNGQHVFQQHRAQHWLCAGCSVWAHDLEPPPPKKKTQTASALQAESACEQSHLCTAACSQCSLCTAWPGVHDRPSPTQNSGGDDFVWTAQRSPVRRGARAQPRPSRWSTPRPPAGLTPGRRPSAASLRPSQVRPRSSPSA